MVVLAPCTEYIGLGNEDGKKLGIINLRKVTQDMMRLKRLCDGREKQSC